MFEIGKRLKHVKENDLAHGEWEKWLGSIDMTPRQAQRFMKVVTELGENASSVSHLGIKTLYEIATMPEEEREKPQVIPSTGETKAPVDMTTRELQEVRKSLKAAEQALLKHRVKHLFIHALFVVSNLISSSVMDRLALPGKHGVECP